MEFRQQLAEDAARVERVMQAVLAGGDPVSTAMRYAALGGGKRLRAHLVYESCRMFEIDEELANQGAAAIELVHAYSLVHDDLPAMDNDDLRRGKPTVHVKWNEWTAILVGDALQARAFSVLKHQELAASLALAAEEMVRGQYMDLAFEKSQKPMAIAEIETMQRKKTGALIEWSVAFGARAAGENPQAFLKYAHHLGLAFQIWDDVLDVVSHADALGKTVGKDANAGKVTFVEILGLEGAQGRAEEESNAAKSAIAQLPKAQGLRELADFVISRKN